MYVYQNLKKQLNHNWQKIVKHILYSCIFALLLISPDLIFHLIQSSYPLVFKPSEIFYLFLISFIVLTVRSIWIKTLYFLIFLIFSLVELAHYSYFGTLIAPFAILWFFTETKDTLEAFFHVFTYIYVPFVLIIGVFIPVVLMLLKSEGKTFTYRKSHYIVLFLLLIGPLKAGLTNQSLHFFNPLMSSYSNKNFYMAASLAVGRSVAEYIHPPSGKNFLPYSVDVIDKNQPNNNVIVVMGESLGYTRMSLFGYSQTTTPMLDSMKQDKNFCYKKAISCGVSTMSSVPLFFNTQREPDNSMQLLRANTSLFKLAKDKGYTVHYITTQDKNILGSFLGQNVNVAKSEIDFKNISENNVVYDVVLLNYLKSIDLSKPNFIVLHQRCSHAPYELFTPNEFRKFKYDNNDFHSMTLNTYQNAIGYTDYLLFNMIDYIKQNSNTPTLFFATADHNELMGENGLYGHGHPILENAKVPFVFYSKNGPAKITKEVAGLRDGVTHYEITKIIAEALGYSIHNPNENGDFYINGIDVKARGGFITFKPNEIVPKL